MPELGQMLSGDADKKVSQARARRKAAELNGEDAPATHASRRRRRAIRRDVDIRTQLRERLVRLHPIQRVERVEESPISASERGRFERVEAKASGHVDGGSSSDRVAGPE